MFGFTEFEIHKVKGGSRVRLVTGKTGKVVMESKVVYKDKNLAYAAAERWCKSMLGSLEKGAAVRFV